MSTSTTSTRPPTAARSRRSGTRGTRNGPRHRARLRRATIDVAEPRDDWCTRQELLDWGYSDAGITRFFGPETEGPQSITEWTWEHIHHVEETMVLPVVRMVNKSFTDFAAAADILGKAST